PPARRSPAIVGMLLWLVDENSESTANEAQERLTKVDNRRICFLSIIPPTVERQEQRTGVHPARNPLHEGAFCISCKLLEGGGGRSRNLVNSLLDSIRDATDTQQHADERCKRHTDRCDRQGHKRPEGGVCRISRCSKPDDDNANIIPAQTDDTEPKGQRI